VSSSKNFTANVELLTELPRSIPLVDSEGSAVVSEVVTFENKWGMRIVGFHDFARSKAGNRRWMIILPGYGETKTDVLTVSYFLAKQGLHTLRFDYSNHVGESDGDILYTTLTSMKDDILSSIDFLYRRFQPAAVGAIGSSLASRVLLRAAKEDERIGLILNLVSVVDLQKTLFAIYKEDHIEHTIRGSSNGIMDVLGFQVDADHFLKSAIQDGYENLMTTIDDVSYVKAPLVFFAAENDVWVKLKDVRQVFHAAASKQKSLSILKGAMHRLYENPGVVKETLNELVKYSFRYLSDHEGVSPFQQPNLKEIGNRIRKEKARNRLLHGVTKAEERQFWKTYLQKYSFIINVHDYWNLLDFIYNILVKPIMGEKILDAGCGIGNYGTFILVKLMYELRQCNSVKPRTPLLSCFGIDFVEEAILQAEEAHGRIIAEFGEKFGFAPETTPVRFSYCLADLESNLPFEDNTFDKICCNLVISYLQNPKRAVAEMVRVLKPRGRIVVSSLKPFADLSEVYRNFIRVAVTKQEIQEARMLLNNAGLVRAKEADGIYQFFSEEELGDLFRESDVNEIDTYRSFGNQANIVVGSKA